MAANLMVRRSTARLLCLFRSQVASFFTERPYPLRPFPLPPPQSLNSGLVIHGASTPVSRRHEDYSKLKQYWMKYNPLRDGHNSDVVLDDDKEWQNFIHPTKRIIAHDHLQDYLKVLSSFRKRFLSIAFNEHLVKHCSYRKIQWDVALKFEEAFYVYPSILVEQAEHYYNQIVEFRDKKEQRKGYQATLLKEVEKAKEELREENRQDITDEVMREIEEDVMKKINEELVEEKKRKEKKKKVNEEMVATGDSGMATPN